MSPRSQASRNARKARSSVGHGRHQAGIQLVQQVEIPAAAQQLRVDHGHVGAQTLRPAAGRARARKAASRASAAGHSGRSQQTHRARSLPRSCRHGGRRHASSWPAPLQRTSAGITNSRRRPDGSADNHCQPGPRSPECPTPPTPRPPGTPADNRHPVILDHIGPGVQRDADTINSQRPEQALAATGPSAMRPTAAAPTPAA